MAIGITMGDACGIGPEIILKAWNNAEITDREVIIGDLDVLKFCNEKLGYNVPLWFVNDPSKLLTGKLNVFDCRLLVTDDVTPGQVSMKCGQASLKYIELSTNWCKSGKLDAMVTLPVNKEAISKSSPGFNGHTGYIAELCKVNNYTMMLVSKEMVVTHVSTHIPLKTAIKTLNRDKILNVITLTHEALIRLGRSSRIAVAGLNPHAGEAGNFGTEDDRIIRPAVESAIIHGMNVTGPEPPDTVFYKAFRKKQFDAVVCMYHDQGHIPMKLMDFEGSVNVTLGLPIVRTSVDHGTAFDIAYEGLASTRSLDLAIKMARQLL